jgi:hypothetical protein
MPKEGFRWEVERELTGREEEPAELKRRNRELDHVLGEQLRMYSSLVFTVLRN